MVLNILMLLPIDKLPVEYPVTAEPGKLYNDIDTVAHRVMGNYAERLWPNRDVENDARLTNALEIYLDHLMQSDAACPPCVRTLLDATAPKVRARFIQTRRGGRGRRESGSVKEVQEKMSLTTIQDGGIELRRGVTAALKAEGMRGRQVRRGRCRERRKRRSEQSRRRGNLSRMLQACLVTYICTCSIDNVEGKDIECGESFDRIEDLQDHGEKEHVERSGSE
ncbi:uncharacterized protein LTR77_003592 [Saxophila tyrrhenica]|uniref:C2H2-type domain-containing protein n=1 Tax=Saxophila tyrrhenica TaxID=1690608 RepID=A0AAV9PES1_9PEZI|nr:hypothetical protein LTR77_003592 [Saxophila tyrrhenica]